MEIDIVILANTSDLAHYGMTCRAITSLNYSNTNNNIGKIVVVESVEYDKIKSDGYHYGFPRCSTIHPEQKFNYNQFLNIGISECSSDWLLLCNNDIKFHHSWLDHMTTAVGFHPEILSFSPKTPSWHLHMDLPNSGILEGYQVSKHICGWCILVHRSVIEKCELFDEQFEFWYQDNDYAMTLQSKGIRHALVCDSIVDHVVSGSHDLLGDRNIELTHLQQEKFNKKWNPHL